MPSLPTLLRILLHTLILLSSLLFSSAAAEAQVTWLWPDNSSPPSYSQNDIINASWISSTNMMPLFMVLCLDGGGEAANISFWAHSTDSRLIPLDLWVGPTWPYTCHFDFMDGGTGLALHAPSNAFTIHQSPSPGNSSAVKIWSRDGEAVAFSSPSSPSTSTSNSSATVSAAAAAGSTSTAPTSQQTENPSVQKEVHTTTLSVGAIVGIVLAAVGVGAGFAGAGVWLWVRRRRGGNWADEGGSGGGWGGKEGRGWGGFARYGKGGAVLVEKDAGLEGGARSEVEGGVPFVGELDGGRVHG